MEIKNEKLDPWLTLINKSSLLNLHQFVELVVKKIKSLKYKSQNWGSLQQVKALHPLQQLL